MAARAVALELRIRRKGLRDRRPIDILATHSPPLGVGDGDDPTHRGFSSFHRLTARVRPKLLIHGHVHPYGRLTQRRELGDTTVVNVVGRQMLDI
jgi:Icc-related predicted phosphoesterase